MKRIKLSPHITSPPLLASLEILSGKERENREDGLEGEREGKFLLEELSSPFTRRDCYLSAVIEPDSDTSVRQLGSKSIFVTVINPLRNQ